MPTTADVTGDFVRILDLPCWQGRPTASPLTGGMTNRNYLVEDRAGRHVVRFGEDLPHHAVARAHERAVARAAHAAGLSPEIEYAETGVLVMRFVEGRPLTPEEIRDPRRWGGITALLRSCHQDLLRLLPPPGPSFCPFQTVRRYAQEIQAAQNSRAHRIEELVGLNEQLAASMESELVAFGHNDLLAGNILDDGQRLWLINWDYAALATPLFDLANLATNNGIEGEAAAVLLTAYFGVRPAPAMVHDFQVMRVASLLRETFWSMVSELHPTLEFDYAGYTRETLARLKSEIARFERER